MSTKPPKDNDTDTNTDIEITLPPNLSQSTLESFIPYQTWRKSLTTSLQSQSSPNHPFTKSPYSLKSITVQSCDFFGGNRLGFLKLKADISNANGEHIPGSVFMRGGSVAMLIVLSATDADGASSQDEYVILTVQPRVPAGSMGFVEIPAGMIDDSGTFSGAAAKEIREETGLEIEEGELVDMTRLAIVARDGHEGDSEETHLQQAVYPSPGGCDEFIPIFLVRKRMAEEEIQSLKGKLTGLREHGEKITLKICKLRDLWKVGARDGKTLAAVALYEGLKREGRL